MSEKARARAGVPRASDVVSTIPTPDRRVEILGAILIALLATLLSAA
jgi:hypothetical protein